MKYIPIAVLEEQSNEAQTDEGNPIENDPLASAAEPLSQPDMNDVPIEEDQVSENFHAEKQDLNKSTVGLSLNLNARDGDGDGGGDGDGNGDEEPEETQALPNDGGLDGMGE
ncbi:hypothetical protein L1987_68073 [Smallanthus sonchifolius]|uniref:Uncharacterized protein n=1 Tax=Smallanthus sonchifolius TaxID=185202 RepID=A0ACB9B4W9_9ASTR|nr:hypothetical protein L1987_68073 [Smallanthus sonchifolius]